MSLKIYFGPGSCALAALAALEEAKAEFEPGRLLLADREQCRPEFLAVNPRGQVPVLVADGQVITENIAVLTFIANRFRDARLLPLEDPAKLARGYELLSWFATNVHIAVAQIFRPERFSDDPAVQTELKKFGLTRFKATLTEFDGIASQNWLLGDDFSVADPLAFVTWRWAQRIELDLSPYPAWTDLAARVKARPSVTRAIAIEAGATAPA